VTIFLKKRKNVENVIMQTIISTTRGYAELPKYIRT